VKLKVSIGQVWSLRPRASTPVHQAEPPET